MPHSTTRSNFCRISSANAANALTCCAIILPTLSQPNRSVISGVAGGALPPGGGRGPNPLGAPPPPPPAGPPPPRRRAAPPPPGGGRGARPPPTLPLSAARAPRAPSEGGGV